MGLCKCGKRGSFGYADNKERFCVECKHEDMKNVEAFMCRCGKRQPCFGLPGHNAICCKGCKEDGMENVKDRRCKCGKSQPTFGFVGEKALCCKDCKDINMVDLKSRKCPCGKRGRFGYEGNSERYCGNCKKPDMKNSSAKKCVSCDAQPSFGLRNGKITHCAKHKGPGMVNLRDAMCTTDGCTTLATFALPGHKKEKCFKHKKDDMVSSKFKPCAKGGCKKNGIYRRPGEDLYFCKEHKEPDMGTTKHRTCKECKERASYGVPSGKTEYCLAHKKPGMIDVTAHICKFQGCLTQASFGERGGQPVYCTVHAERGMENLRLTYCEGEACTGDMRMTVAKKGDLCVVCRMGTARQRKYEDMVRSWLSEWNFHYSYKDNGVRSCEGVTTQRRPDFMFVLDDKPYCVILEVDEQFHAHIESSCEMARMVEIRNALPMPVVFVRFNPATERKDCLHMYLEKYFQPGTSVDFCNYGVHVVFIGFPSKRVEEHRNDAEYRFTFECICMLKRKQAHL